MMRAVISPVLRLPRRSLVLGVGAFGLAAALSAAALLGDAPAPAARRTRVPAADEVVAHVDPESRAASRAVAQLAAGDVRARVELARRAIARSRRTADPRELGRAQAALAPWWTRSELPDEVRLLRASIAQSLHDFAAARADLEVLKPRRPDDVQLHLILAAVATVTADYPAAQASCDAVARLAPALFAAACKAPVELVRGRAEEAYHALAALDAAAADASAAVRAWSATLLGELAAALGQDDAAEAQLRRALTLAPDAYGKAALADLLLRRGRAADARALLADDLEADGLLLRLAIAERRLGDPAAAAHAAALRERFAATVARGDLTHRREQGLFALDVEGDAEAALEHLRANWQLQREPIDALLLLRAAAAAHAPQDAAPVLRWMDATGIRHVELTAARQALRAQEPS